MTASDPPGLGLGTWENENPDQCAESVRTALELGYRHIDTAQAYENERAVGRGIAAADVERDDVFLATKVSMDNLTYDDAKRTARESLDRLGVDYVDLLYVHWPIRTYDPEGTLAAFDELYEAGVTERVGVSNFEPETLDEARNRLDAPIFANQIELHPFLQQRELREYAADHDHRVVAYSPLARGDVLEDPALQEIAEKHGATPAQVSLAWLDSLENVTPIPKATSEAHIRDNWAAGDLELDAEDIARIEELDEGRRKVDFAPAPWNH
jgi:diketogulonate reductase-like aldo/keto reductase